MSNPTPFMPNGEKTVAQRILDKKNAQLEEQAPEGQADIQYNEEGSISTHPLENSLADMAAIRSDLQQIVSIAGRLDQEIESVASSGDASRFLNNNLANDPALWEAAKREVEAIRKKMLTVMSLTYDQQKDI